MLFGDFEYEFNVSIDSCSRENEEDSSIQIINSKQQKEMPHDLCPIDMEHTLSSDLIFIIQKGSKYDMDKRPTALDLIVLLKNVSGNI